MGGEACPPVWDATTNSTRPDTSCPAKTGAQPARDLAAKLPSQVLGSQVQPACSVLPVSTGGAGASANEGKATPLLMLQRSCRDCSLLRLCCPHAQHAELCCLRSAVDNTPHPAWGPHHTRHALMPSPTPPYTCTGVLHTNLCDAKNQRWCKPGVWSYNRDDGPLILPYTARSVMNPWAQIYGAISEDVRWGTPLSLTQLNCSLLSSCTSAL